MIVWGLGMDHRELDLLTGTSHLTFSLVIGSCVDLQLRIAVGVETIGEVAPRHHFWVLRIKRLLGHSHKRKQIKERDPNYKQFGLKSR